MKNILLSISLFFLFLTAVPSYGSGQGTDYLFPFPEGETLRYSVEMSFVKNSFTGICIVKNNDGKITGSMINEFGTSIFDFTMNGSRSKVTVFNIMKPIDRRIIRKGLEKDLKTIFSARSNEKGTVVFKTGNREYKFIGTSNDSAR